MIADAKALAEETDTKALAADAWNIVEAAIPHCGPTEADTRVAYDRAIADIAAIIAPHLRASAPRGDAKEAVVNVLADSDADVWSMGETADRILQALAPRLMTEREKRIVDAAWPASEIGLQMRRGDPRSPDEWAALMRESELAQFELDRAVIALAVEGGKR